MSLPLDTENKLARYIDDQFFSDNRPHAIVRALLGFRIPQKKLKDILGMTHATISQFAGGRREIPKKHLPPLYHLLEELVKIGKDSYQYYQEENRDITKAIAKAGQDRVLVRGRRFFEADEFEDLAVVIKRAEQVLEDWGPEIEKIEKTKAEKVR